MDLSYARVTVSSVLVLSLTACTDPQFSFSAGYKDGYHAGYETECGPRAVLVDGDFRSQAYREGLEDGYRDGSRACREGRSSDVPEVSR